MNGLLVLNAGSSSIKFAVFATAGDEGELLRGQIDGIGDRPRFRARTAAGEDLAGDAVGLDAKGEPHAQAITQLLAFIEEHAPDLVIAAVGHRVVHGGPDLAAPVRLDADVIAALEALVPLAPLHQPHNLAGIRAAARAFPDALQVACFDTAFHRTQPWVADTFALPRRYYDQGVRRYGFHGLSYASIIGHLQKKHPSLAAGRVIVAHLGNGASLCAIRNGRAIGSTMGFTALDGMPMGTRSGQLDPGVVIHLMREEGLDPDTIESLLYKESGLLGLSGISGDWRRLTAAGDGPAAEAMAYFTHRALIEIGGLTAILGGLDGLVFTAGIGEHASGLRHEVAKSLGWLGIVLDDAANEAHEERISTEHSKVAVLVVPTDEEAVIAEAVRAELASN